MSGAALEIETLVDDIRLLLRDGTLINGADAYLFGMRRVWWARPFGYLLGLPELRWLTWQFYKLFNRNRFRVSRACRLVPQIDGEKEPISRPGGAPSP